MKIPDTYPKHIQDQTRAKIAQQLILHELKKLFPNLSTKTDIEKLQSSITGWWDKPEEYKLEAIRDFWNGVDGLIMGLKLKDLVPRLTAENIAWVEKTLNRENLIFSSNLFENFKTDYNINGKSAKDVAIHLQSQSELYKDVKKETDKSFQSSSRADDPLITIEKKNGDLIVLDGNGRLLKAIIYEKPTLDSFVGVYAKDKDETELNPWIPTSYLMQLIKNGSSGNEDETVMILTTILKKSESACIEFFKRAIGKSEIEKKLKERVANALE